MQKISDYLDEEEITRILNSAAKHSKHDYLMIKLMWQCGLRVSEVSKLMVEDIDFTKKEIKIAKSMSNKDKYVPVPADLLNELRLYLDSEKIEKGHVFLSARKKPISPRRIQQLVERYAKEANIEKHVTSYMFREAFAAQFLKRNEILNALKQALGHF